MTPTLPLASGTSSGTGQSSPNAPASSGSAQASDFLSLLTRNASPQQGTPTLVVNAAAGLESDSEGQLDSDALEALGLLPISLPMFATETRAGMLASGSPGLEGMQLLGAKQGGAALDLQMLTEMIQSEQAAGREGDGLEPFHLQSPSVDAAHSAKTSAADLLSRPVHVPVGNAQWADEIGSRLTLMAEQGKSAASLRLSPEHLGPLEIRIAVRDDQASVWFGAAHADTRAAIEHALPRLRELFEAQGMTLADAGVSHEAPREQPNVAPRVGVAGESDTGTAAETSTPVRVSVGLLDAYA